MTNRNVKPFLDRLIAKVKIPVRFPKKADLPNGYKDVSSCLTAAAKAVRNGWKK